MNKILILFRGLPGAGKTTLAKALLYETNDFSEVCADDFFTDDFGGYHFDASKLADAHEWCLERVLGYMAICESSIIGVHNTFTTETEMEPYFKLASEYGYRVFTVIVENRHGGKSAHGVPDEKMQTFRDRFEVCL